MSVPMVSEIADEFIEKIPKRMKTHMTANLRAEIIKMLDSEVGDAFQETMLVNTDLIDEYSMNPERYIRAVKFASYINMGKKVYEAFALSHPEKYKEYKEQADAEGWDLSMLRNKLSLKGANFKNTQIVTKLLARSVVPLAIAFSHHKAQAVGVLADLMLNADSQRVQMESADKLLTHLNLDKTEFKVDTQEKVVNQNVIATLANALDKMVSLQQREKEINPTRSNAAIMDAVVSEVTRR